MSDIFKWNDEYLIGIDEIDAQHKRLFSIASTFEQAKTDSQSRKALMEVFRYTREHFTLEELFMKKVNYPGYLDHKHEHEMFIDQLNDLVSCFDNSPEERDKLITLLAHWVVDHICNSDHLMTTFVDTKT
ncbi:MAG: hemerythrin family protein [Bacteroidetes bacterium]|nr:hemerythrin family protein [Bacteroidota bacterium]